MQKNTKGTNTVFYYNEIGKVLVERYVDNKLRIYDYDRASRLISKIDKNKDLIKRK